ncbi:DUF6115 domain-containing protein [Clostridium rectalis]|uniref:DUF6115 domain-containing protein n=1 Tax=Clostridium rectalis TaxID=2040295 RepID=UPI000F62ECE9|nr:hypothetical protein [Clostridium rectalis]
MIIILILTGTILIVLNVIALKKEQGSFRKILDNKENNMENFQIEIGKVRKDMAETIFQLQSEVEFFKKEIENIKKMYNVKQEENENISEEDKKALYQQDNNVVKIKEVEKMISSGMSVEDISNDLGIGKGEVLLIKELYLK